jgi:hypothetical protein
MKNLHLIPTDKPSRLHLWTDERGTRLELCDLEYSHTRNTQNIYITSDEEIKEGDFVYSTNEDYNIQKVPKNSVKAYRDCGHYKKIILTTDVDLIADGVQAIDDEFLEWFIKNPSCESVEVDKNWNYPLDKNWEYKIIIPKEEPKQDSIFENAKLTLRKHILANKEKVTEDLQEMREKSGTGRDETLEEAADNWVRQPIIGTKRESFIAGYKLAQERMYSEEDFKLFARQYYREIKMDKSNLVWTELADKCLEQFKKK